MTSIVRRSSQWFKPAADSGVRAIKACPRQARASPARLSTTSQSGHAASSRTTGSKAGYKPGATSTTYRITRLASRVASHCTSVHSAGPALVRATSTVTPAAAYRQARRASGQKPAGRSFAPATNATVTSTIQARLTASKTLCSGAARSATPAPPASATVTHSARVPGLAATSSAANGSATRLTGARAANSSTRPRGASDSADVPLDVRQQRELASPLDRGRELALMARAHSRQPAGENLAALGEEAAERAIVLVVKHPYPGFAHGARLGGPSHASSSSISSTTTSAAITAGAGSGFAGRPSDTTTRKRSTPSSSFTARSYSGKRSAAVSNCATT